jgi:diguanylate cyclase (GGDEF)-like protein
MPTSQARTARERQREDEWIASGLRRLGDALDARAADVVVGAMTRRSPALATPLDRAVEESFERAGTASTTAVARWMAGEGEAVAREAGEEAWRVFAQLAAQLEAPLNEIVKHCLSWRDCVAEALDEAAGELGLDDVVQERALGMLQRSVDVTAVRVCELFEEERRLSHEELARRQRELVFLATHDALTGLPNRTLILDRIEQALTRARPRQEPVAALFIDLDNFKAINDSLGHGAGDELLCAVANRLEGATRETDALGRLGGDEFVVIAEGLSLAAGPELIAERLLEAFEEPFALAEVEERRVFVKASIGIATDHRASLSAEELLHDADIAMYRAKWGGRDRYLVFEPDMREEAQSRLELEMDLREALDNEEFFLVYQPTFDLERLVPTGVEALIRWRRPGRGVAEPEEFVPLLEESGLVVEVGSWVLHEACAQAAEWQREGRALCLAVNVSARQFETDDLLEQVGSALRSSGFEAAMLTLEITETALMRDAGETARRLAALKDLGVRIAVDDFGTGYSSLAHLRQLPIDMLKIDRSFVAQLDGGGEGEILLSTLIDLGKALSIETTAEGIERPQDLTLIKAKECDSGQGFLLAHPLSAQDAGSFFSQWPPTRRFEVRHPVATPGRGLLAPEPRDSA